MFGKRLINFLRGGLPPAIARAEGDLSPADRQAFLADLSFADAAEPGLGEALATYVIAGENETAKMRVEAILKASGRQGTGAELREALFPSSYPYGDKAAAQKRRLDARFKILFELEGFDPAVWRRYGLLLAPFHESSTYRYGFPGSDRSPMWLRSLVDMVSKYRRRDQPVTFAAHAFLTAPRVRAMLALEGATATALIDCLFVEGDTSYGDHSSRYLGLDGLADVLVEEVGIVKPAVTVLAAPGRAAMVAFIGKAGLLDRDPRFLDLAFALAGDGSKAVREAAVAALATAPAEKLRVEATRLLAGKSADGRLAAVNALVGRFGAEALPELDAHEAGETAKKVLQAIVTARATLTAVAQDDRVDGLEDGSKGYLAADGSFVAAPPRAPVVDGIPDDSVAVLRDLITAANDAARRDYDALSPDDRVTLKVPGRFQPPHHVGTAAKITAVMRGEVRPSDADAAVWRAVSVAFPPYMVGARKAYLPGLNAFLDRPDVSLAALTRLALTYGGGDSWHFMFWRFLNGYRDTTVIVQALMRRIEAGGDFREVAEAADAAGQSTAMALEHLLTSSFSVRDDQGEARNPTVWAVLAEHFAIIDAFLSPGAPARGRYAVDTATNLLGYFPRLPRRYLRYLLDRAAEGDRKTRTRARSLLKEVGDLTAVITPMLQSGEQNRRVGGARWLAERRDPAAIPALRAALATEKAVTAKAAILSALAACGDDISDQFSEERLIAEAEEGLPKTKVDYSALFDAEALPPLRWADGREVPRRVVQWWFARAHKLKQAGGDPLLHMAFDRLDRSDAERLGAAVLSAFIQLDTRRPSSEEANAYAKANATSRHQSYLRWRKDYTEAEAFAELRRETLATYCGSALDHRGLLALARYAPPAESVAMVKRYLRDHGKRANQCRALIDALAANPVPAVLQLILATSQRHKQPGTRKYAGEMADALAEERGWSASELADRTMPTAGLDDDGFLDLAIGERTFRARIEEAKPRKGKVLKDGGFTLVVENPDGKVVASLPSPTDPAGEEEAKAARKTLSTAKKELKQTIELQTARLYEAMCAGRIWPAADFEGYLLGHPIVGRLLRRLILTGHDADGRVAASFRALEDGSFSDAEDGAISLDAFHGIGLAHRVVLGPEAAEAWAAHLADYEVTPLFEQLDRPGLALADAKALEVGDRIGHMIDNFALRAAATALGFQRGSIEDGGCFYAYEKHFSEVGIAAVIAFTGSSVPESERRQGALKELTFVRLRPGQSHAWGQGALALGKVPHVLLSEAWTDYHAIAAQGSGFDADWEKKSGW